MAADYIDVRINGLLGKLRPNSVVMSVSTFVQQAGRSTLGILPTLFFVDIFVFFHRLPGGIRGFDALSALVLWSPFQIIAQRAADAEKKKKGFV